MKQKLFQGKREGYLFIKNHLSYFIRITYVFFQSLLLIVYVYAGIVKINEDWLRAEPLRHWLGIVDQ